MTDVPDAARDQKGPPETLHGHLEHLWNTVGFVSVMMVISAHARPDGRVLDCAYALTALHTAECGMHPRHAMQVQVGSPKTEVNFTCRFWFLSILRFGGTLSATIQSSLSLVGAARLGEVRRFACWPGLS